MRPRVLAQDGLGATITLPIRQCSNRRPRVVVLAGEGDINIFAAVQFPCAGTESIASRWSAVAVPPAPVLECVIHGVFAEDEHPFPVAALITSPRSEVLGRGEAPLPRQKGAREVIGQPSRS